MSREQEIEAKEKAAPMYGLVENNRTILWAQSGVTDPGWWFCRVCGATPGARSPEHTPHKPDCPVPGVVAELKEARKRLEAMEEVVASGVSSGNLRPQLKRILKGAD